jgi:hypothetical protein
MRFFLSPGSVKKTGYDNFVTTTMCGVVKLQNKANKTFYPVTLDF